MNTIRKILYALLFTIASLIAIGSILSVLRDTDSRFLKMLDFPRIQLFIVSFLCLLPISWLIKKKRWYHFVLAGGLLCGLFINGFFLINYTAFVSVDVPRTTSIKPSDVQLGLLMVNVKMSNRQAEPLLKLIHLRKPDLILAMEVDDWWNEKLNVIKKDYPYSLSAINNVAYGMILYSKVPLNAKQVNYLQNKNVPSFNTILSFPNGKEISFQAIHPVPPTHFEDLPDNAGQQEVALKKLGRKIADQQIPTIVAGDLNDVVWSYVDELTRTKNMLFDVRVGRGFYNSYNAENIFMRWPLDHVFVTKHFSLMRLDRLPKIGSDHFPIFVKLVF